MNRAGDTLQHHAAPPIILPVLLKFVIWIIKADLLPFVHKLSVKTFLKCNKSPSERKQIAVYTLFKVFC